jgi:hypothetical protein
MSVITFFHVKKIFESVAEETSRSAEEDDEQTEEKAREATLVYGNPYSNAAREATCESLGSYLVVSEGCKTNKKGGEGQKGTEVKVSLCYGNPYANKPLCTHSKYVDFFY